MNSNSNDTLNTMVDWLNRETNCFDVVINLGCTKNPPSDSLQTYWNHHRNSLLVFLSQVHKGVRGSVTDWTGRALDQARISVKGSERTIGTSDHGEYWRLFASGIYNITAAKLGYSTSYQNITTKHSSSITLSHVTFFKLL